ncbi:MAG: UDP-N-acetylmuramate dehydrogenase [Thauera sp.]|nr:UDP-N-acetylmuramate dehydrogenase [Thauera sp.]
MSPATHDEVKKIVSFLNSRNLSFLAFGSTSNLLFSDQGLRAVAICIGPRMSGVEVDGDCFHVKGGTWVPSLARSVARAGYSGFEHVCGIPGTVGGLVMMNGGSLRRSASEYLVEILSVTATGETRITAKEDCGFGYRRSHFQDSGQIITGVTFRFEHRDLYSQIRRRMLTILSDRRAKFPQRMPNCGSVFKAHDEMYAQIGPPGAVLDKLGFKGRRIGGAQVSLEHANFINNVGGACASDVRRLAHEMKEAVFAETGYLIEPEACFVESCGRVRPLI